MIDSKENGVILFNPRSAPWKHRLPNSILQVGASLEGKRHYTFVDGNLEKDPEQKILELLSTGKYAVFGSTVMPGPQLRQAIPISKKIREQFPNVKVVWGGYFASNQYRVVLNSEFVDFVINGPGDYAFIKLLDYFESGGDLNEIRNLIYQNDAGEFIKTAKDHLPDLDKLTSFPYDKLNEIYPLKNYFGRTFMGRKTASYHSSFGCPFTCSFCAVVPIYNARWKGKSAEGVFEDILYLINTHGIDSIEFHDNNFFTSRKRTVEFAKLIEPYNIKWWGEGRIDTLDKYSDEDLILMKNAGCEMIFFGAETGNDEVLKQMNKGGKQSSEQILQFADRMRKVGIIPEYSFVLGMPGESEKQVNRQIDADIQFIKKVKDINPDTEIIIYVYSPVPTEGSDLYQQIIDAGFKFPERLEDWLDPVWENFDLRKNPLTPWLKPYMIDKIRNFETVLNARYPTVSDFRIRGLKKTTLNSLASWRYKTGLYHYPYEIKFFQKIWKYRQPEITGFYSE